MPRPLRILTWHVHGSYLWYLCQTGHEFVLPVSADGTGGRAGPWPWPDTVREVPEQDVAADDLDLVLCQAPDNWTHDRAHLLTDAQLRTVPTVYLEHDPPRDHPTDTRHVVDDPDVPVVHVSPFNRMMWDCGRSPTVVIDHGVMVPAHVRYDGSRNAGIVVVNNLLRRGRRLGLDIYLDALDRIPLHLYGMDATSVPGGAGEIPHTEIARTQVTYRFFFNPIRYTSMGLAVCEAMQLGMPIVAVGTTEHVIAVHESGGGFAHTEPARLVDAMRHLLDDAGEAARLGSLARHYALERFGIDRFCREWNALFADVSGRGTASGRPRRRVLEAAP